MQGVPKRKFALFAKSEKSAAKNFSQRAKISSRRSRPGGAARTKPARRAWRARRQPPWSAAPRHPSLPTSPSASPRLCSRSRPPSRGRRFACSALPCGEGTRPPACSHQQDADHERPPGGERGMTRAERRNMPEPPTYEIDPRRRGNLRAAREPAQLLELREERGEGFGQRHIRSFCRRFGSFPCAFGRYDRSRVAGGDPSSPPRVGMYRSDG